MRLYPDILIQAERWQEKLPGAPALVERVCTHVATLSPTGAAFPGELEVSIVLCDDAFIQTLNASYRGKNTATNVLSFPSFTLKPGQPLPENAALEVTLGDVIIALETVEREATEGNKTFEAHVTHMLVHGMLHLLGYDHIMEADAEAMEALEVAILKELGINSPY